MNWRGGNEENWSGDWSNGFMFWGFWRELSGTVSDAEERKGLFGSRDNLNGNGLSTWQRQRFDWL